MATGNVRENSIAELLSELSQESAGLIREELRLMAAELAQQGRRVGTSAGLLGGAGVLGLGAFGALTAGLISLLGRRPARGPLLVATLYGAGAGALANAGVKRLSRAAPEAVAAIQRDVKAAATGARRTSPATGVKDAAKGMEAAKTAATGGAAKTAAKGVEARAPAATGGPAKAAAKGVEAAKTAAAGAKDKTPTTGAEPEAPAAGAEGKAPAAGPEGKTAATGAQPKAAAKRPRRAA